jgi:rhamnogalacturonan endolyase
MSRHLLLPLAVLLLLSLPASSTATQSWAPVGPDSVVVFEDNFATYPVGALSEKYTAVQEYHWTPKNPAWGPWAEAVYWGHWQIDEGLAWHIRQSEGRKVIWQKQEIPEEDRCALVLAGDRFWTDYAYEVEFVPLSYENPIGIVYRVANSRNYFQITLGEQDKLIWVRRQHDAFGAYISKVRTVPYKLGEPITFRVEVTGVNHTIYVNGKPVVKGRRDHHHPAGKIGLLANSPAEYRRVRVIMSNENAQDLKRRKAAWADETNREAAKYPQPELYKKIDLKKLAVNGRQMRWGDLDGDGQLEFVVAQRHFGAEGLLRRYIAGLTAFNLDGEILWQWGKNDTIPELFATDLPYQLVDLDGDKKCEVVFSYDFKIEVLDGLTGELKKSVPTPLHGPKHPDSFYPEDKWDRIPAGALHFADLTGAGTVGDFIIKDDYNNIWAYDRNFKQLWTACLNAGHYPFIEDIDNDGRDEILQGYTLFDHDGSIIFDLGMQDHNDGGFIGATGGECFPGLHAYFCAGEEGVVVSDLTGKVRYKEIIGHAQRAAVGDFRPEEPGCEFAAVTYWGEHNIITMHAADGRKLDEYQPHYIGSTLCAVDWVGDGTALMLLAGNEQLGGMIDGYGRQVVRFSGRGHPELCCDAINITGDSRDEILLWDRDQLWIYTQGDNVAPPARIVPLKKMPLHSRSNYQVYMAVPDKN